jgi:hypothetical protein
VTLQLLVALTVPISWVLILVVGLVIFVIQAVAEVRRALL